MSPVRPKPRPAWTRESAAVRIEGITEIDELSPAWAWGGADGAGVRVAVIDSGIDASHPALEGCVDVDGGIEVTLDDEGEIEIHEGAHTDAFGHGTACAGIIHSIAPAASVTSIRVLNERLAGRAVQFLHGLEWAIDQGFDVVNLSLGTIKRDYALAFHELCDRAYFGSTFLVTAANNMQRISFPSLYSSVASVACNLSEDPWRFHYNPEPPTEFLARGIDVEVPWKNGETQVVTGNSYAAPHMAGLAALVLSKHSGLRPFQLKTVLWGCAANVQEAGDEIAGRLSRVVNRHQTGAIDSSRRSALLSRPPRT
jgi:subtilisin family serine protease